MRDFKVIRIGFEPMTLRQRRIALSNYNKKYPNNERFYGDSDWIRTNDLLLRRQLLYPAELPNLLGGKCTIFLFIL